MAKRQREHGLYVSFSIEDSGVMCIAEFPDYFISEKVFRKSLTRVANSYKQPFRAITAIDCVCDLPQKSEFSSAAEDYYNKMYAKLLPKLRAAFAGGKKFASFDLWKWNETSRAFKLVRTTLNEYGQAPACK